MLEVISSEDSESAMSERAEFLEFHYSASGSRFICLMKVNALEFAPLFEKTYRRLAQLVRALGRHPRGHQFESGTAYHDASCYFRRSLIYFLFVDYCAVMGLHHDAYFFKKWGRKDAPRTNNDGIILNGHWLIL